ncbi:uncharacterized protein C9orf85 homolog [Engraulis encrasicolus]|uniref:uncharacterized protein C9orf85 homolog n=1 Tax=Engraulis encrasicolus TaxID=184585 RepID=UPI002FD50311
MSSQKGNTSRTRAQKHKNTIAFKSDKYGATPLQKKLNEKVHDGVCQRCKEVLEWKVKYNKFKPLTQARKCVKCTQKSVKDAYHIMCKPCSLKLELCAKCGKKEEIIIPVATPNEETAPTEQPSKKGRKKPKDDEDGDLDDLDDLDLDSDCDLSDDGLS